MLLVYQYFQLADNEFDQRTHSPIVNLLLNRLFFIATVQSLFMAGEEFGGL